MKDGGKKRNRGMLIVGGVLLACAMLSLGAAAVGGAAFALTQGGDRISSLSADVSLALPARAASTTDKEGIVIAAVVQDGPATEAGVERGDILLALDGVTINTHRDLLDALEELEPGDDVEVLVLHGDEERRLRATPGEQGDRAFLGVIPCCPMQEGISIHRELDSATDGGALIIEVIEGSPAEEAGLALGDVILAVDGETLEDGQTLVDSIAAHEPGDRVTLQVRSAGDEEPRELALDLGEHPDKQGVAYLGVRYAPGLRGRPFLPPRMPRWLPHAGGDPGTGPWAVRSVRVEAVDPDSPAEVAGLRAGDVILSIDGSPVQTPRDVVGAVSSREPGDTLALTIRRSDEEGSEDNKLEISVTLGEHPEDEERGYLGVRLGFHSSIQGRLDRAPKAWRRFELPENWGLPFEMDDLPELPEHWELPFNLEELPDQFRFEWPPGHDAAYPEPTPGSDSV